MNLNEELNLMAEEYKIHLEENENHLKAGPQSRPDIKTRTSTSVETSFEVVTNLYTSMDEASNSKYWKMILFTCKCIKILTNCPNPQIKTGTL